RLPLTDRVRCEKLGSVEARELRKRFAGFGVSGDLALDDRHDLGSEQLDRAHHLAVGDGADADVREVALRPEELVEGDDLRGYLLRRAERERARRSGERFVLGLPGRWPAALPADPVHHPEVGRGEAPVCLPARRRDEGVSVDRDLWFALVACLVPDLPVEVDERLETGGLAADDRERQRQAEPGG